MHILLVEDDIALAQAIKEHLARAHYTVSIANDGIAALEEGQSPAYDAIIMDVMLPVMSGIEVTHQLREKGVTTPIIMVTALGEIQNRVDGLNAGADYYIPKPFAVRELLAALAAVLRRHNPGQNLDGSLIYGELKLEPDSSTLFCGEESVSLTTTEREVLEMFLLKPEEIHSKAQILDRVWGDSEDADDNNVEAYISFLRKKLKFLNAPEEIVTIRGEGYLLCHKEDKN